MRQVVEEAARTRGQVLAVADQGMEVLACRRREWNRGAVLGE